MIDDRLFLKTLLKVFILNNWKRSLLVGVLCTNPSSTNKGDTIKDMYNE
jgi:hypothetical protein